MESVIVSEILSLAQYSLTVQNSGLKQQSFISYDVSYLHEVYVKRIDVVEA